MTRSLGRLAGAALVAMVSACQAAAPPALSVGGRSADRDSCGAVSACRPARRCADLQGRQRANRGHARAGAGERAGDPLAGRSRFRQRRLAAGLRRRGDHRAARWPHQGARRRFRPRELVAPARCGHRLDADDRRRNPLRRHRGRRPSRRPPRRSIDFLERRWLPRRDRRHGGRRPRPCRRRRRARRAVGRRRQGTVAHRRPAAPIGSPPTARLPMSAARVRAPSRAWQ